MLTPPHHYHLLQPRHFSVAYLGLSWILVASAYTLFPHQRTLDKQTAMAFLLFTILYVYAVTPTIFPPAFERSLQRDCFHRIARRIAEGDRDPFFHPGRKD